MKAESGLIFTISRVPPIWIQLGSTVLFFFLIKLFLSYILLSSLSKVIIEAEFDHPDVIDIYYSVNSSFDEKLSKRSQLFTSGEKSLREIQLGDHVARKMRIDLGAYPGTVKLHGLTLTSHFGETMHFTPRQIAEQFIPNSDIEFFVIKDDYLLITSRSNDPFITIKGELRYSNFFFSTVLPLVFSYAFFLFISNITISNVTLQGFPAIHDLNHKESSMGVNIGSLDGIRGLAVLMVLAEHTGVLNGIGALGVRLFFALSGFLLATPFVQEPSRAVSYSYMSQYLLRRLRRILPMYYTFITITMLLVDRNPKVFRHYLFLQGDGHLWTIPQEMFFYLILPFVVIAIFTLCRGRKSFSILLLLLFIQIINRFLTSNVISFYGYGTQLPSLAGIFLSGVLFSYIYHWLNQNSFFQRLDRHHFQQFCSFLGLALIIVLIFLSAHLIEKIRFVNALHYSSIFGFMAGVFILLIVLAGNSLLGRIMSFYPLRAVGLVGFSFYLLHPLLLSLYKEIIQYYFHIQPGNMLKFVAVGVASYLVSTFTYTYIERPFLGKQQALIAPRISVLRKEQDAVHPD
jgi:peptidoglycan/LPS O-acetylase OafA/YrhL